MTIAWLLYVLLVGALLAVAAAAVDGILRRTSRPTRWVWVCALAAMAGFAAAAPRRAPAPGIAVTVAPDGNAAISPQLTPTAGMALLVERARSAARAVDDLLIATAGHRLPDGVTAVLLAAWATTSGAMLLMLVAVNRRVARERHEWPVAEVFGTQVRITPAVGPAVIGLSAPEIVVPRWLLERSADEQRLVIVHEREHVTAKDQLLPVGGLVVAALLPWHPAAWWALSRLRLAIELDCDARVLSRGVHARSYGTLLIDIAGQCAGHRVGALALADRPSHLERRLLAMKNTTQRFTLVRAGALGAVALLAIVMACEARLPTSAEVEQMDVASAEKALVPIINAAVQCRILTTKLVAEQGAKNVVYTVDGATVTAEQAHAITSSRIATVNVSKGRLANTKDSGTVYTTVSVRTLDASEPAVPMSMTGFNGLLFVDGVLVPAGALSKLAPGDIESIDVIKGVAATKLSSDPAAANGVIRVTTKHQ